ncbi:MAG: tetratricopeptide repeat protein, partial [Candidatus Latescibacteria bacterium]|nr:tetratricopeptide repeat protein [Candidatus Latescibacterota bacterium]
KETVFTLPFAILLVESYFFEGGVRALVLKLKSPRAWLYIAPFAAFLLILPALLSFDPQAFFGTAVSQRHPDPLLTPWRYLITQFRVLVTYIRLLFVPVVQNFEYDYPAARSLFEARVLLSLLILVFTARVAVRLFRRERLLSFGIAWFFLTLSVESTLKPLGNVIFEHRLYLPMFGFALFLCVMLFRLFGGRGKNVAAIILLVIVILCSVLAVRRNAMWRTDITLWSDVVKKSPGKARPHTYLGAALIKAGDMRGGLDHLRTALELDPNDDNANHNIGSAFYIQGNYDEAEPYFRRAVELDDTNAEAWYHLGVIADSRGAHEDALALMERSLALNPGQPDALYAAGNILVELARPGDAAAMYRRALTLNPGFTEARNNLANTLLMTGSAAGAVEELTRILASDPENVEAHINLGIAFADIGEFDRALGHARKALALDPDAGLAHYLMGSILRNRGEFPAAIGHLVEAVRLDPGDSNAHLLLAECYDAMEMPEKAREHRDQAERIGTNPPR